MGRRTGSNKTKSDIVHQCYVARKNDYFLYFFPQDDEELKTTIAAGSKSLLPVPVQELIKMIFDVESMKKTLVEFEVSVACVNPFYTIM